MITLLLKNIELDKKKIQAAFFKKDFKTLYNINHKLLGGVLYCDTPRLASACFALQAALKNSANNINNIDSCVQAVLTEMQTLQKQER